MNIRFEPPRRAMPARIALAALATAALLSGCNSLYSEGATAGAGIAGAAIASKVTNNAAVATASASARSPARAPASSTRSASRIATRRNRSRRRPARSTSAASAPWSTHHSFPIEDDEHGRVTVSRMISVGPLDCKEIVFAVDTAAKQDKPAQSAFYVATICRDGPVWKWASAEPATERWGALQ